MDEEQRISTTTDGCVQGTAYVRVHELQWLSGMGSRVGSEGFSHQFAIDATVVIALDGHAGSMGDRRQDFESLETDVCRAAVR